MLDPLIYAIFIVLHNYPSTLIRKRYDTTFQSLAEAFRRSSDSDSPPRRNREGKGMKLNVVWLEGVLDFFNAPFPYDDRNDPRRTGFNVGQQTVGLYLTEMLLKYALDHSGVSYEQHHNLRRLFTDLSESHRGEVLRQWPRNKELGRFHISRSELTGIGKWKNMQSKNPAIRRWFQCSWV